MSQPLPAYLSSRQLRLGPVLLLVCGMVGLYLVAVSHFMVSCLDQIRQAVEATRQSYLPEALYQQQDAVNAERLHRFAAVVLYADDSETRRQALLNVQVMALNASPTRALGSRTRLRLASQLVEQLARLRKREHELSQQQCRDLAYLAQFSQATGLDTSLRQRLATLLAQRAVGLPSPPADQAPPDLADRLAAAEGQQEALRVTATEITTTWTECEGILDLAAESIGASACLSLDNLIGELAEQVHDLQRLVSWLLTMSFVVLVVLAYITYRNVVQPVLACARAAAAGDPGLLPPHPRFREIRYLAAALGAPEPPGEADGDRPT